MLEWTRVLGGFGLFLFALRVLSRLLRTNLNRNLRTTLVQMLASPLRCVLAGIAITLVVQANSITVLGSMALLSASIINLEQAFYLALGAGLGGSLRGWYSGYEAFTFGPLLVGGGSLLLVLLKRERFRVSCEALAALGFAFWGLHELAAGIQPASQTPQFRGLLQQLSGPGLTEHSVGVLTGALLASVVQSSTEVLTLVARLVSNTDLQISEGAALVLGANVGTTFVILLASLEFGLEVRRLAVAHFLSRLVSLGLTLLFLPQFLGFVQLLVDASGLGHTPAHELATLNTTFNLLVLVTWGIAPYLILSPVQKLVPEEQDLFSGVALPMQVRKLFSRSAERCAEESESQLRQLSLQTKNLLDENLRILCHGRWHRYKGGQEHHEAQFEALREAIVDLLIRGLRANPDTQVRTRLQLQMRRLLLTEKVYTEAFQLRSLLRQGLVGETVAFSAEQIQAHKEYAEALRPLWIAHLDPPGDATELPKLDSQLKASLGRAMAKFLEDPKQHIDTAAWMFSVYSRLRGLAYLIEEIVQDPHGDAYSPEPGSAEGEPTPS